MKSKQEILKSIIKYAHQYKKTLVNKFFCFVYKKRRENIIECFEIGFFPGNFVHLIGVITDVPAKNFFRSCLENRLSVDDFEVRDDGATALKMSVFSNMCNLPYCQCVFGTYTTMGGRVFLKTDKIIGDHKGHASVGFVYDDRRNIYVPNTLVKYDAKSFVLEPHKVVAVYIKQQFHKKFQECIFQSEQFNPSDTISSKIDFTP